MTRTMLVVDDEAVTRRMVQFTLKSLAIEVISAEDATSALKLFQEHPFDMLLIDINLPDTDGFTLIEQMHTMDGLPPVSMPIAVFTARNNPDDEMRAQELGVQDFLYKPFSTQELRALVSKYIRPE